MNFNTYDNRDEVKKSNGEPQGQLFLNMLFKANTAICIHFLKKSEFISILVMFFKKTRNALRRLTNI